MAYIDLYLSFFKIGFLCIGGGYAALPLIKNEIVDVNAWISLKEFIDIITVAEMTPGPIALNAATFVGIKHAGIMGAVSATLGFITAPAAIVTLLGWLYFKYKQLNVMKGILSALRPAVVGLIAAAALAIVILAVWGENGVSFNTGAVNITAVCLIIAGLICINKLKISPVLVILATGAVGAAVYLLSEGFL